MIRAWPSRHVAALVPAVLAVLALAVQWGTPAFVRIPTGLALALVLPGLALTDLAFGHRVLATVERLVLSLVLSVAVLVLGGLAMFAVGIRLGRPSWAVLTASVTVVAGVAASVRRRRTGVGTPAETTMFGQVMVAEREQTTRLRFTWRLMPLALAALLLAAAGAVTLRISYQDRTPFTALSLVPASAPTAGQVSTTGRLRLTVRCEERRPTNYTLQTTADDGQGGATSTRTFTVALSPGQTWSQTLPAPESGTITAELFRSGDRTAYRTVRWAAETR